MMDISIRAHRENGSNLIWLAHCDGKRAWVTSVFPSERRLRERDRRKSRTLIGEFPSSDAAFRAAWGRLMQLPDKDRA